MCNKNYKCDPELIEYFIRIASIPGLSGEESHVARFIQSELRDMGYTPYEDDAATFTGGYTGNIICKINDGGDMVLMAHMDTARSTEGLVPVYGEDRLTSDGKSVLGVDDRVGVACLLYALKSAIKNKMPLRDFTLLFTTHEETTLGGSQAVNLNGTAKMGVVFDSRHRPGCYVSASSGAIAFRVRVHGKAAHSGIAPEKGIDAITITANAISSLKMGRINEHTTANIGTIHGGSAVNVVPDLTEIIGEVRSTDPHYAEEYAAVISNAFENAASEIGGSAEFFYHWDFRPYHIPPESEVMKRLTVAMQRVALTPEPVFSWGGSDANSLNAKGILTVNVGTGAENPHSNDEYILYEDLQKTFELAQAMMTV